MAALRKLASSSRPELHVFALQAMARALAELELSPLEIYKRVHSNLLAKYRMRHRSTTSSGCGPVEGRFNAR